MKRVQSAPWKPLFQTHVSKTTPPTFTLATTSTSPPSATANPTYTGTGTDSTCPPTPRCRTMVFRGFLASLPPNPHNPLSTHNPRNVFASDALTFTTDSRMAKAGELLPSGGGGGDATALTAGGAYVEALFWIAGDGDDIQNQWRVRGRCYLLAEADADACPSVTDVLRAEMAPTGERGAERWSWRREVQAHFGNMTPALRGSFANPVPGTAVGAGAGGLVKGGRVPDGEVMGAGGLAARARANMRVGVIVPEVVERLDLREDEGRARRWVYEKVGGEDREVEGGRVVAGWKVMETWP